MAESYFDPEAELQPFRPGAGALAWLLPGLGHLLRGEHRRGRLIMLGLGALIVIGLLVGGVDCVDHKRDRLWFFAQALCGPVALLADLVNQQYVQALPEPERFRAIAINKPNEMGTLFVALAGLMNLVVILDATFAHVRPETIERRRRPAPDSIRNAREHDAPAAAESNDQTGRDAGDPEARA